MHGNCSADQNVWFGGILLAAARFQTSLLYRGETFLKKLWCCVGGEYNKIIWFYQLG